MSAAVLLLELLLTRIFSVTLFYHLSFMVVSLAMLGFGASGLLVTLWPGWFGKARLSAKLAWSAIAFSVTSVVAVGVAFRVTMRATLSEGDWVRLAVLYFFCLLPFLAGGLVVSLILTHHAARANRLYFFDLLGAAAGCLAFIPLTNVLGAPTAVLVTAAVAAIGAAVLARDAGRVPRGAAVLVAVGLLVAATINRRQAFFDVRSVKGGPPPPLLAVRWNSFSRVEVIGTEDQLWERRSVHDVGTSSTLDPEYRIAQALLRYDADAASQITQFDGDASRLLHLGADVTSAAHHLRPLHDVLVIGPGGGRDLLTALHLGSGPVTGVEINPLTVQLMRTRFRTFSGGLYDGFPGVRVVVDEARSYLRSSGARFDLIQATLVDTWAASAAGAYSLTENDLYTVEAFEDYLSHLTPDGVVSFSRWVHDPPVEPLKVVRLSIEAMKNLGIADPQAHVVVVQTLEKETKLPPLGTILVKRSPFSAEELARLRDWADAMRFSIRYSPDDLARGIAPKEVHPLFQPSADDTYGLGFEVPAVHDDRPFFFNNVSLGSWLRRKIAGGPGSDAPLSLGGRALLVSVVGTGLMTALLLLLPLLRAGAVRSSAAPTSRGRPLAWALYFAALGLGFIMIEIVLIQRFGLFLGYPVYSLTVVLFTLLLTSGLGSLLAQSKSTRALPKMLAALCAALVVFRVVTPALLDATRGAHTPLRIAIAAALIAPLGVLMGMPFATGLRQASAEHARLVPWAWAVNGGTSVLGSTLTIVISMTYGFTASLQLGILAYAVAFAVTFFVLRPRGEEPAFAASRAIDDEPVAQATAARAPLRWWPIVVGLAAFPLFVPVARKDEADLLPTASASALAADDVRFGLGWYDREHANALSWRWMGARAETRVRNVGSDMTLHVAGYMPVEPGKPPPTLTIELEGKLLDSITSGEHFSRQYTVPRALQSQGERSSLVLEVSATVKPPNDPRDLGFCLEALDWTRK